ncbi:hypothetical protein WA026_005413 [Henosepilachna vigintioctopunctata]|uniref:Uncharacterized protein n=1 Tax=Henosepilachna vigintioctopunctata TaxID=420089 RepID=A0AAW1U337_9CUCU
MMFKHEDSDGSKPTGIYLIDFQLSMLDSPVKDLSYFLYTACDKHLLEKFEHLLQTYYDSLCATLKLLGCVPEECLTYECLLDHWKKYGGFGLIMSTFILKLELLKPEEVLDLAHLLGNDSQSPQANTVKMDNEEFYNNRIFDCFVHFGEMFL